MQLNGWTRREYFKAGLAGAGGALAAYLSGPAAAAEKQPSSLTITKVETFPVEHKIPKAIGPSIAMADVRDSLIIKISTDSGLVGWGETADVGGTRGIIEKHLKHAVIGKNPLEYRKLWNAMWGPNFADGRAVGGMDIALHDLRGKALGLSIADMYGGRNSRDRIMGYSAAMNYVEGEDPEKTHPVEAARLAKQGWLAMKIRTGRYGFRKDIEVIRKIREAVGPDIRLMTDGNGVMTFPQAVKFGKELEKLDFYWFEEPMPQAPNYAGYSELAKKLNVALAGGEVLDWRGTAREHIVNRSFDIIQPDVSLCGGIAEVLFISEMARLFRMQAAPHCWAGTITLAATLQVLSLFPPHYLNSTVGDEPMMECDVYENPFRDEIVTKKIELKKGYFDVPTGPGLGIEIDEKVVKKYVTK